MNLKDLKILYQEEERVIKQLKHTFPHLSNMSKEALLAYFNCTATSELVSIAKCLIKPTPREVLEEKHYCHCTDRNSIPKLLYTTYSEAQRVQQYVLNKRGIALHIYRCPSVEGWHLSK